MAEMMWTASSLISTTTSASTLKARTLPRASNLHEPTSPFAPVSALQTKVKAPDIVPVTVYDR